MKMNREAPLPEDNQNGYQYRLRKSFPFQYVEQNPLDPKPLKPKLKINKESVFPSPKSNNESEFETMLD